MLKNLSGIVLIASLVIEAGLVAMNDVVSVKL